jgi:hypothetical protein
MIVPARLANTDHRRSRTQADFWNPTGLAASRSRAATSFGEGGSIWSVPSSVMTTIVLRAASPAAEGQVVDAVA